MPTSTWRLTPAPDTSVTGLYRCRHIDLLRVTSAAVPILAPRRSARERRPLAIGLRRRTTFDAARVPGTGDA